MSDTIARLNPNIKPQSVPDIINRLEKSDRTFVIYLKGGKWYFQIAKGETTIYEVVGILRCICAHFEQRANKG